MHGGLSSEKVISLNSMAKGNACGSWWLACTARTAGTWKYIVHCLAAAMAALIGVRHLLINFPVICRPADHDEIQSIIHFTALVHLHAFKVKMPNTHLLPAAFIWKRIWEPSQPELYLASLTAFQSHLLAGKVFRKLWNKSDCVFCLLSFKSEVDICYFKMWSIRRTRLALPDSNLLDRRKCKLQRIELFPSKLKNG